MIKKLSMLAMAILLVAGTFSVTGCNTTRGFGQDMENAGESLQDSAR